MNTFAKFALPVLLTLLSSIAQASPASSALSQVSTASHQHILAAQLKKGGKQISEAQAASIARRAVGGKVLKVQARKGKSGTAYRVKLLLPSGKVKQVTVSADGRLQRR